MGTQTGHAVKEPSCFRAPSRTQELETGNRDRWRGNRCAGRLRVVDKNDRTNNRRVPGRRQNERWIRTYSGHGRLKGKIRRYPPY